MNRDQLDALIELSELEDWWDQYGNDGWTDDMSLTFSVPFVRAAVEKLRERRDAILAVVPPEPDTELWEIMERFDSSLDVNDLSDLSRMCREYASTVSESRIESALAEQRTAVNSWKQKFDDLNAESLRLFRENESLRAAAPEPPTPESEN